MEVTLFKTDAGGFREGWGESVKFKWHPYIVPNLLGLHSDMGYRDARGGEGSNIKFLKFFRHHFVTLSFYLKSFNLLVFSNAFPFHPS
jgi:hypothetical protein